MSEQVTIEVSDHVVRQATSVATQTQLPLEEVLSDWLESAIAEKPVHYLSDSEVMALAESQLPADQQEEMSELLGLHCEGELKTEGQRRLDELMRVYERGLLRKAQALREAVVRGLREPLQP